ncbi:MAG: hypothetical protein H6634_01690 [Anaerolineales bacterium]|nr:hypothetical protein [Anaerolineales bacterium]
MNSILKTKITKPLPGIQHEIGFAYKSVFTFLLPVSRFFPVQMWLLEDGKKLPGISAISHKEIRELGAGRFSFWEGTVYFSASDNSDPRNNGRVYTIQYIPNLFTRIIIVFPGRTWRIFVNITDYIFLLIQRVWKAIIPQRTRHFVQSLREWILSIGGAKELPWELFYWFCFLLVILRGKISRIPFIRRNIHEYKKANS